MSNNKLVMRRPVRAPKPRRLIGQEVFRTIVEMAYEMERAQKAQDDWDHGEEVLQKMMDDIKLKHIAWLKKRPSGPHTVLAENPRSLRENYKVFSLVSEPYRHPYKLANGELAYKMLRLALLVDKRRDYDETDTIIEFGQLALTQQKHDGYSWLPTSTYDIERGFDKLHIYDDYGSNDTFEDAIERIRKYAIREYAYARSVCFKP